MRSVKPKRRKAPTVAKLKKQAWKLLSEVIRREAAEQFGAGDMLLCYTCGIAGRVNGMQAGHAIGGRTGSVLLDEEIIRPQCYRCNVALRGNYPVFVTRLIREKASNSRSAEPEREALDWWEAKLSASSQVREWNRSELEAKIEEYKARLSRL